MRLYHIGIFCLGFSSGVMFTLVSFIIPYQFSQTGYSTIIIGTMFLVTLPYCFKPVCAPFIDNYSIPILCKRFGQRRGWMLATQICLLLFIGCFTTIDPFDNLSITSILIFTISFFIATLDTVLDAYRIECSATKEELSLSIAFSSTGFRIGMLISSAGGLYLSYIFNWSLVYIYLSFIAMITPVITLYIKEPITKSTSDVVTKLMSFKLYFQVIQEGLLSLKQSQPHWISIMIFIFLYKASDSIPMAMSSPLFIDLSFTSTEIASISKCYGLIIMSLGSFLAGVLTAKIGIYKSILIAGIMQLLSPLMFMFLSIVGHDILIFTITITVQNFFCGLGGTVLLIYLSSFCKGKFIATQYSIISSFSSFSRIALSFLSGICANYMEWPRFFLFNALFSMLFVFVFLKIHNKRTN